MKILVLHPKACRKSAVALAEALGAQTSNPFEDLYTSDKLRRVDVVFNYGCGYRFNHPVVINSGEAVRKCVSKIKTFEALKQDGIPIPEYVLRKQDIPAHWENVYCRKDFGKKNEGLDVWNRWEGLPIPDADFYTRNYNYESEYRVMVIGGVCTGIFRKDLVDDGWELNRVPKKGLEDMAFACEAAALSLGIDYVGFDVLSKNKKEFIILEANSGAVLQDESIPAIKKLIGV